MRFPTEIEVENDLTSNSTTNPPSVKAVLDGLKTKAELGSLKTKADLVNGKIVDNQLPSIVKTINGKTPDNNGDIVVSTSSSYDDTVIKQRLGNTTASNVAIDTNTYNTSLASKADLVNGKVPSSQLPITNIDDSNLVHKSGDENIAGIKTFSNILQVNASPNQDTIIFKGGVGGAGSKSGLAFDATGAYIGSNVSARISFIDDGAYGAHHIWETKTRAAFDLDTNEKMRLLTNGNLGIGTTNPSEKVEVSGNVKAFKFIGDGSQLINLTKDATKADLVGGKVPGSQLPFGAYDDTILKASIFGRYRGDWLPNTAYSKYDFVDNNGTQYYAPAAFTSGTSFDASNWTTGTYQSSGTWQYIGAYSNGNIYIGSAATITLGGSCTGNVFFAGQRTISLGDSCSGNALLGANRSVKMGASCIGNRIGYGSFYITFGAGCTGCEIGANCANIQLGDNCVNVKVFNTKSNSDGSVLTIPSNTANATYINSVLQSSTTITTDIVTALKAADFTTNPGKLTGNIPTNSADGMKVKIGNYSYVCEPDGDNNLAVNWFRTSLT